MYVTGCRSVVDVYVAGCRGVRMNRVGVLLMFMWLDVGVLG